MAVRVWSEGAGHVKRGCYMSLKRRYLTAQEQDLQAWMQGPKEGQLRAHRSPVSNRRYEYM